MTSSGTCTSVSYGRALAAAEAVLAEVEAVVGGEHDVGVLADRCAGSCAPAGRPTAPSARGRAGRARATAAGQRRRRCSTRGPACPSAVRGRLSARSSPKPGRSSTVSLRHATRPQLPRLPVAVAEHRREERVAGVVAARAACGCAARRARPRGSTARRRPRCARDEVHRQVADHACRRTPRSFASALARRPAARGAASTAAGRSTTVGAAKSQPS